MSKKQETRERIMGIALKLFSEQGYYSTTTKEIAEKAGLNEITLFRHFGSKENLFQETTEQYVHSIDIKGEIKRLIKQDFEESMIEISRDYLDFCFKNKQIYKIQMRLKDDESHFVRLKLSREFVSELEIYFQHLVEDGTVQGDPHVMAVTLIDAILGAFTVHVLTNNTFSSVSIEDLVLEHTKQFVKYYKTSQQ